MKISGIILAAGASTRMTKYKQLLRFKGQSLLNDVVSKCSHLDLHQIICITGYLNEELKAEVGNSHMVFIHNNKHEDGMVSSLQLGINHLLEDSQTEAALVMLTDQPLVPLSHYQAMLGKMRENSHLLMATSYNDTIGVPAIYSRAYFSEILSLDKHSSAKSILKRHQERVLTMECAEAGIDIDTDQDYQKLLDYYE